MAILLSACVPRLASVTLQEFSRPSGTHGRVDGWRTGGGHLDLAGRSSRTQKGSALWGGNASVRRCVTRLRSQAANVNVGVDVEKVEFSSPRPEGGVSVKLPHVL